MTLNSLPAPRLNSSQVRFNDNKAPSSDHAHEFINAMRQSGLDFKGELLADGEIHRFDTKKRGHKDGWYVSYGMAGAFGDWSRGIHEKWSIKDENLSIHDKKQLFQQIAQAQKAADEERMMTFSLLPQISRRKGSWISPPLRVKGSLKNTSMG
jgi:phage/plasmid primase-like uncharacterized protein